MFDPFRGLTIPGNATVGIARSRSPTAINFCPFGTLLRVRYAAVSKPESLQTSLAPPLGDMNKEEFRRFGHELIDWIADYFDKIEELPVLASIEPGDLKSPDLWKRAASARNILLEFVGLAALIV